MSVARYVEFRNLVLRQGFPTVFAPVVLRDADSNYVPIPICERLVQAIWYDQRLHTDRLRTTDDRPVRVLFPGWWNLEAGPDFRNATIQVGDAPELTGDIEVHLRGDDWFHHRHDDDPRYNNVVLHVVLWETGSATAPRTAAGRATPQLILQSQLAAPLEQLHDEIDLDAYPHNVGNHEGPCASLLANQPSIIVTSLLDAAGEERFVGKQRRYARWLHRSGPAQAFYEGWMEALGYKANKTAFRALAQRLPLAELADRRRELPALFFGVAGFLPTNTVRARSVTGHEYVTRLWKTWWKLRAEYADRVPPADLWRFHGQRPANHPHRRLGAAIALLKKHPQLLDRVTGAVASDGDPAKLFAQVTDEYWSRHFTLGGKSQAQSSELIGAARARELVSNVVLPFLAAVAEEGGDAALRQRVAGRYAAALADEPNSLIELAARQLFGSVRAAKPFLTTARRQQGLMQVFHDFCVHDKSICHDCHFPELLHRWAGHAQPTF